MFAMWLHGCIKKCYKREKPSAYGSVTFFNELSTLVRKASLRKWSLNWYQKEEWSSQDKNVSQCSKYENLCVTKGNVVPLRGLKSGKWDGSSKKVCRMNDMRLRSEPSLQARMSLFFTLRPEEKHWRILNLGVGWFWGEEGADKTPYEFSLWGAVERGSA